MSGSPLSSIDTLFLSFGDVDSSLARASVAIGQPACGGRSGGPPLPAAGGHLIADAVAHGKWIPLGLAPRLVKGVMAMLSEADVSHLRAVITLRCEVFFLFATSMQGERRSVLPNDLVRTLLPPFPSGSCLSAGRRGLAGSTDFRAEPPRGRAPRRGPSRFQTDPYAASRASHQEPQEQTLEASKIGGARLRR